MPGPKLNEKNREPWGTKGGTRASAKYIRMSASKARVVLNLIRDKDVRRADEILQFTDREAARVIRKLLASAVANAVSNDELDADDLFVNFDDGRTEAGLEVLRELSTRTQVLFLTHHEHLLPLAQRLFGASLNVVRMDRTPVAA